VLGKVVATQLESGSYGYTYNSEDGSVADPKGFSSCWFAPGMALLYSITRETKYLESVLRAMAHYRGLLEGFDLSGGPHDISKSPDEEGVIPFIKAARILHETDATEGNATAGQWLADLKNGLDYEFSWKFSYNADCEVEPLKSLKWQSRGGSVTSVNNSHIHPMGSAIIGEIIYAAKQTGDPYLKDRAKDTVNWTLNAYLHRDGEYGWGLKGMINERFCYTDSLLLERFPDGTPAAVWFCGHSWASGSVLEGLIASLA
jgi:hypothetical protein